MRSSNDAGLSIIEVLLAMSVALGVMAATLTMVSGLQRRFAGEGERADMQQRIRVASDALYRDLVMAGAGAYRGAHSGPLGFFFASVMPFRQGAIGADPPGTFKSNTITLVYLSPAAAPQATIRQPLPARSGSVLLNVDGRVSAGRSGLWVFGRHGRDGLRRDGVVRHIPNHQRRGRDAAAAAHDGRYPAVVCSRREDRRGGESHLLPRRRTKPPPPIS